MTNQLFTLEKKQRNALIDLFRIVCAIMVIIIHAKPFKDINPYLEEFFVDYLPRIAVPFFLCTISYFYVQKLNSGAPILPTWIRLFRVYLFWSGVYFIYHIVYDFATNTFVLSTFIQDFIFCFFVNGVGYQLWFFPAVFLGLFVLTLCHKFKVIKIASVFVFILYVIALLGSIYFGLGIKIPVISSLVSNPFFYAYFQRPLGLGLGFIFMGYFLDNFLKFYKKNNKLLFILLLISIVLFALEIYLAKKFNLRVNVKLSIFLYPLTFLVMVLLLTNTTDNPKLIKLSKATRDISNFMYYSHILFLFIFRIINESIVKIPYFYTVSCFAIIVITILLGYVLHKCKNQKIKDFIL